MEFTGYSSLWKAIIRPPRANYKPADMGPSEFKVGGTRVIRTDINITNKKG